MLSKYLVSYVSGKSVPELQRHEVEKFVRTVDAAGYYMVGACFGLNGNRPPEPEPSVLRSPNRVRCGPAILRVNEEFFYYPNAIGYYELQSTEQ